MCWYHLTYFNATFGQHKNSLSSR